MTLMNIFYYILLWVIYESIEQKIENCVEQLFVNTLFLFLPICNAYSPIHSSSLTQAIGGKGKPAGYPPACLNRRLHTRDSRLAMSTFDLLI